jgi:hypothetical protein
MEEKRNSSGVTRTVFIVLTLGILVGISIFVVLHRTPVAPPTASGDLNPSAAEELSRKLAELSSTSNPISPKRVEMTQQEINAFLRFKLAPLYPKGVSEVRIGLGQQQISTRAKLNFDEMQVNGQRDRNSLMKAFFRGEHQLEVSGKVNTRNGLGRYEIVGVWLDRKEIPKPLVDLLLQSLVLKRYPAASPNREFALPYGIDKIEFSEGKLVIFQGVS